MPPRRIRVAIRAEDLYLNADDVVTLLRDRARRYIARAEQLAALSADPDAVVEALDRDLVTTLDEALACRMVAEELEQRADELERLG